MHENRIYKYDSPYVCLLLEPNTHEMHQCLSNSHVHRNRQGILLKYRLWFNGCGEGLRLCISNELLGLRTSFV